MIGKLIVIDGIDGAGKTTQIELLKGYLASQGLALQIEVISFPRYGENLYADLVTRYLEGEFGGIDKIDPHFVALAYAGDRALAKPLIESWLGSRKLVIANRYVSSSKAHLSANLPEDKKEEFMKWLDNLEYKTNGLPKPSLNILLKIDPKSGQQNVKGRRRADMHEKDLSHESKSAKIYLEIAEVEENWKILDCMENKKLKSKEEIHKLLVEILGGIL